MLSAILAILGSGSFGSIIGLVGGLLNRKVDLQAKEMEYKDRQAKREHDLKTKTAEREMMQAEYNMRLQVSDKENEGKQIDADKEIEVAGYSAQSESFKFAAPTSADGGVDRLSKAIRPILTILAVTFTAYIYYTINELMRQYQVAPDPAIVVKMWVMVIEWAVFQSGVIIGWWFAMRPGKPK